MKALAPRAAIALATLGALSTVIAAPGFAAAEQPGPRQVAIVLDPPPASADVRARMMQAASMTLLGLAGTQEQDLIRWAVIPSDDPEAARPQTLGEALGKIRDWQQSKNGKAQLEAATDYAGSDGLVIRVMPEGSTVGTGIAIVVGSNTAVPEAVAHALERIWRDEPRVLVRGPARQIQPFEGVAQQTVISTNNTRPSGMDKEFAKNGQNGVWAWHARAPGLRAVEADQPVIAILTLAEVRITECPDPESRPRAIYSVWPADTARDALRFRLTGPSLPAPALVEGREGYVQHATPLFGDYTITPLLSVKDGANDKLIQAGAARRCEVWPPLVATPRIDVQADGDAKRIRVTFIDLEEQPIPAARVLEAGPLSVQATRGRADAPELLPLEIEGEAAFAPLPSTGGETLVLEIPAEESERRLLGSASATVLPAGGGGVAPWLVGIVAALVAALIALAWPWLSSWLIGRLPTAAAPMGQLTVEVDDRELDKQLLDGETLYPLTSIMRPVPLGTHKDAPKLVRLELVRGFRGVRVVAFIAEGGRVRTRSRPLSAATPWQCDGLTVRFSG